MTVRQTDAASSTQAASAGPQPLADEDRKALRQAALSGPALGSAPAKYEAVAAAASYQEMVDASAGSVDSVVADSAPGGAQVAVETRDGPKDTVWPPRLHHVDGDAPPGGAQVAVEVRGGPFDKNGNLKNA